MTTSDKPAPLMRFREHRGLLQDSMATLVYISSDFELRHLVEKIIDPAGCVHSGPPDLGILDRTHVELYADEPDDRIGWAKTWVVTVDGYGVVGFTDRPPTDLPMWTR